MQEEQWGEAGAALPAYYSPPRRQRKQAASGQPAWRDEAAASERLRQAHRRGRQVWPQQPAPAPAALQAQRLHGLDGLCCLAVRAGRQGGAGRQPRVASNGKQHLLLERHRCTQAGA